MKKHLLLICLLLCLTGCTADSEQTTPPDTASQQNGRQFAEIPETPETTKPEPPIIDSPAVDATANANQSPEDQIRAVYFEYCPYGYLPFAMFRDGESLFHYHDDEDYDFLVEPDLKQQAQIFETELVDEIFTQYSIIKAPPLDQITFEALKSRKIERNNVERLNDFSKMTMVVNSDSPLMTDVQHNRYTLDDQGNLPASYKTYVASWLKTQKLNHTPVIITDTWVADLDGDSKDEIIILADNTTDFEANYVQPTEIANTPSTQLAYKDEIGTYYLLAFFSETLGEMELYGDSKLISLSSPDLSFDPKRFPLPEDHYVHHVDTLYQYDHNGVIMPAPLFSSSNWDSLCLGFKTPIICDINGDGLFDLGVIAGDNYGHITIYLQENNTLTTLGTIGLPA